MNKGIMCFLLATAVAVTGCTMSSGITTRDDTGTLKAQATFKNESVEDASGHVWDKDEEKINIAQRLKSSIDKKLVQENMLGDDLILKTTITGYEPGNELKRWVMPGWGSTQLKTKTQVFNSKGDLLATIPVERYVGMPGLDTIGMWEKVFAEVATRVSDILCKPVKSNIVIA